MTSEHLAHMSYAEIAHDVPDARVEHHLQPLLDWLQSDLMELASLLSHADKKWFVGAAADLFDDGIRFDDEP